MDNLSGVQNSIEVMKKMICDCMAEVIDENIEYFMFLSFFNPDHVKGLCCVTVTQQSMQNKAVHVLQNIKPL